MKSGNKPEAGKVKGLTPKRSHISDEIISPAKSPRNYDPQTLKLLWGRAAGRCAMADCRIELFVAEPGHDPVCIIGEMGHVVASSDGGPRSNKTTRLDARDKYDNLILLCRNCHRKIDVLHESYTPERLHQIKNDHEAWVRTALPERGASAISWQVIRLQGDFPFDPTTIAEALAPNHAESETTIAISATRSSWEVIQNELCGQVEAIIARSDSISSRIAVFPLAPVSACIYTGYLLTNRVNVRAFQYHRDDAAWTWRPTKETSSMPTFMEAVSSPSKSAELLFLFQLTAPIDIEDLRVRVGGEQAIYECSVADPSTAWLANKTQLDELARKAREMFETAAIRYPQSGRWHIVYAGPAPGAVVIGQQLNPTMIPVVQCYEFQRPMHIESITIKPHDSALSRWTVQR